MQSTRIKRGVAGTLSYVFCRTGFWRKTLLAFGVAAGIVMPDSAKAVEYSATIGSAAGSYYYSLTGTGGISYKSFTSSDSWLKTTSTRVSTSGNSWTVNIYYSVTDNTSSSARTATLTGTLSGNPVSIAITQSGNGGSSGKHVMTLYRNNSAGDGSGARRTVADNAYYTLPTIASLGWTRSGYTFKGWSTSRGGSVSYSDGERIYVGSSLYSLYAVWQSNTPKHVMTLYRNNSSGDGAGARRTVLDGGYYTLPTISSLGWTRSGYTFKGWATYRGGSVSYSDGERIYVGSSLYSLYAVWQSNTPKHVMTLYRNNSSGDGAGARRTVLDGGYYTLPTITSLGWTRNGYTFKGWATYRGGPVEYYDGESIYVYSWLDTLYAVWESNTPKHVMTLYRNNSSGDGAGARRTVADNAYYTLPTIASLNWTRSGYTFKGWSTSRGGSVSYSDGERIYVSSSLSALYAVWTRNGVDGYDFAATVGSAAESYYYSLTGTGGISYKSFTSSASWLKTTSTRVTTSGNSWTVIIGYSVTANMSSSARTATLTGTLGGNQVRIAITQSGE